MAVAHYESAPRRAVEAGYVGYYRVWLQFDDGRKGLADLALTGRQSECDDLEDAHASVVVEKR